MNLIEQLSAIAILCDFTLGVALGIVGGAALGSRREDKRKTFFDPAPDPLSEGARVLYRKYFCDDGYLRSLLPGGLAAGPARGGDVTSPDRDDWGG
jgi:hypothetical protein